MRKWLPKTRRIWALYYKEQLIADGTLAEIAESTGRKYETLYWMTMPIARKRNVNVNEKVSHVPVNF